MTMVNGQTSPPGWDRDLMANRWIEGWDLIINSVCLASRWEEDTWEEPIRISGRFFHEAEGLRPTYMATKPAKKRPPDT